MIVSKRVKRVDSGRSGTMSRTRTLISLTTGLCLAACGWWGHRRGDPPNPTEIVVNGAPAESVVFVDGTQVGQPVPRGQNAQIVRVAPGNHKVDVHLGERVVYHEEVYVASGQRLMMSVLSGWNR
jgi:hypothetical protein